MFGVRSASSDIGGEQQHITAIIVILGAGRSSSQVLRVTIPGLTTLPDLSVSAWVDLRLS